jgi:glycogen synthase
VSSHSARALRCCLVTEEQEGWGGIGTYTAVMARGLRGLGHRVHVIMRDWERDDVAQRDGLIVHRLTVAEPSWRVGTRHLSEHLYGAREALLWSLRVRRRVRAIALRDGLDVVEVPDYRGAGALLSLGRREPALVIRLHTPTFLTAAANAQTDAVIDRRAVECLERLAVSRADLLSAPSAAVSAAVAQRWSDCTGLTELIANPIDEERFAPSSISASDRRQTTVLYVGRLERVKGVDVLVSAMPWLTAEHPQVRVQLVGEDDPAGHQGASMAAHLRELARALGVNDQALQISGAVRRQQLPALLRAAAVCVAPSRWENFPYSCLEAMSCGCPVVASTAGGLSELITDGVDGLLVKPGDPRELAAAICRVLADRAFAEALGAAARKTVERSYGQRAVAVRTADIYSMLRATKG